MFKKLIANTMEDVPFKKRRFWHHSLPPVPAQACLRTAKEPSPFELSGEPEKLLKGTFPAIQKSHFELGIIRGSVAVASADGSNASAARHVDQIVASLEPNSLVKTESEDRQGLLFQGDSLTLSTKFYSDKDDGALGKSLSSKTERLHWNLNIMMDEWEEPYAEIVNQPESNSEYVANDGIQYGKVTSDPENIQKIADPQCMLLEAKDSDSERNVLQVSPGLINTEKTCAAFENHNPTMIISMNDLDNKPGMDQTKCEFIEQKNNTADIRVEYDEDMSGTPATLLCKLSPESDTTEKSDPVSFGMPILGKPACYVDGMKDEGSEDLKLNSGKDPKLTPEDLSSGCNNSNVSGNNTGHVVTVECMRNLQTGYDSPMEDGELREPDAYLWKNNVVNFSETGQLDNGLVGTDYIDASGNNSKNGNQLCDHQDDANEKGQEGKLDDSGSQTREFGSRKYRKKLSSHDETPYNGPIPRENFAFMQRQWKYENNGCEVDSPVNYQKSRSYNSRGYHDSKDHDRSKLRRVNSGLPAGGSETRFYNNRQFSDKFSNDIYGPSTRKRLPADRDDSYDSYRRAPPLRGKKKRNRKKKSGGFPQRGTKDGYNERLPETYSRRRDHKSSTNFDQAAHISRPYRKSGSESSLCSPTHVSNEQDQRSSGKMSRYSQKQRGNNVEFPRRMKSVLARHERSSQVVGNGRECSFKNSDYDRNIQHDKFKN